MNILLLIVGIVFLVCAFIGYKKGLVKIIASLLATLIIIALVGFLTPYVSSWLRAVTPLEENVQKKIAEKLLPDSEDAETLLGMELSDEQQRTLIEEAPLPAMFQEMLLVNNHEEAYAYLGVNTFGQYVGAYIAKLIADIIAFLITMLVVTIVVRIAIGMLGILNKLPVIGGANRIAGGAVGLGIGFIAVWILFILVTLLYNTAFGKMCLDNIADNSILTKLYDSNILMKFITEF